MYYSISGKWNVNFFSLEIIVCVCFLHLYSKPFKVGMFFCLCTFTVRSTVELRSIRSYISKRNCIPKDDNIVSYLIVDIA